MQNPNAMLVEEIVYVSRNISSRRWIRLRFKNGDRVTVGYSALLKAVNAKRISPQNIRKISILFEPCPVRF